MRLFLSVICIFLICSCQELDDPLEVVPAFEIIRLEPNDSIMRLVADCTSVIIFKAIIGQRADAAQPIIFNTSYGVLTNVGITPSSSSGKTLTITPNHREASVQLNALNLAVDSVIVSTSIGSFFSFVRVSFTPSYPDDFLVSPSEAILDVDDTLMVTVEAFKNTGSISQNLRFNINSNFQPADSVVIDFPDVVKLENTKATVIILNISQKQGEVILDVIMPSTGDTTITKMVSIEYK